jgi:hypothetical protein
VKAAVVAEDAARLIEIDALDLVVDDANQKGAVGDALGRQPARIHALKPRAQIHDRAAPRRDRFRRHVRQQRQGRAIAFLPRGQRIEAAIDAFVLGQQRVQARIAARRLRRRRRGQRRESQRGGAERTDHRWAPQSETNLAPAPARFTPKCDEQRGRPLN